MATTKATTNVAPPPETALTVPAAQALAIPDYIKTNSQRGTENITGKDIRPPALRLAQSTTPQTKKANAKYIEGLSEGMFFNSLTREIYGDGTLRILIINQLGSRNIQFNPGSEGGVLDFNVPDDDPRAQFTTGVKDGKTVRIKPEATKFYDYLILVLQDEQRGETVVRDGARTLMTMSLKGTMIKRALDLNTLLSQSKLDSFAQVFTVTPTAEHKGQYDFYGWNIQPAGFPSAEAYADAEQVYTKMKGKTIEVEVDDEDDKEKKDDIPF